jgi:hypothetical protein
MIASMIAGIKEARVPRLPFYYVSITIDIILLYVINNLIYMNIAALDTGRFISCHWAINLALTTGILGNFILLLYRPLWAFDCVQMLVNFLIVLALFIIYRWFPFNLNSDSAQHIVKIILMAVMAGMGILGLIELGKFGLAFFYRAKPPTPSAVPILTGGPEAAAPESQALSTQSNEPATLLECPPGPSAAETTPPVPPSDQSDNKPADNGSA